MQRTVLIVDDHPAFRESARALLEADGFVVIGDAFDARSALQMASALRPDIVVLDIALPDADGFWVAEQLSLANEPPAVVLVSSRERSAYGQRIDRAKARGFLPKRLLSAAELGRLVG